MNSRIKEFYTPNRFKGRTGLQIFVDRFFRAGSPPKPMAGRILKEWSDVTPNWKPDEDGEYQNDYFYGGNLKGIIAKLDYIKENGFNLIYLSPIGLSETSHHYEPIDQLQIDPWIGTWDDFQELCKTAHRKNILVVVDLVFNHMGIKSPIFQDALNNPNSQYRNWFEWDKEDKPVFWSGFKNMPQCNKLDPGYQSYTCKVSAHYIRMGADGIRYDLGENLPYEFLAKQRKVVKAIHEDALLVSEMWGFDTNRAVPQLNGEQVDSIMNYRLSDAVIRWIRYRNNEHFYYYADKVNAYPKQAQDVLWNFIDSHDTPRAANLLVGDGILQDPYKGDCWDIEGPWRHNGWFDTYGFRKWEYEHENIDMELATSLLKVASAIQYFMPGVPIVFAGTEIGITGYKDPFNRKPYNWEEPNEDLLKHYKALGKLRKDNRSFFAFAGEVRIEDSFSQLKITRTNPFGEMILQITRNSNDLKKGMQVEIFKKEL